MNLTIDIGNTLTKVALFEKHRLLQQRSFKKFGTSEIRKLLDQYQIESAILCSVVRTPVRTLQFLRKHTRFIEFKSGTSLPVRNLYRTPQTLGLDRLASVVGANALFPGRNVLVIDAGTCIKYDLINKNKEYRGGSISPGMMMRFLALNQFTEQLPLVKPEKTSGFIGRNTKESILTGVQLGIVNEMKGFINLYREKYPGLKILLTGGDSSRFARPLKLPIFATSDLVHIGLHTILLHHVAK